MRSAIIALAAAGAVSAQSGYVVSQIADGQIQAPTAPVQYTTPAVETSPVETAPAPAPYTSEAPTAPAYSAETSALAPAPYTTSESVASPVESTPVAYTNPVVNATTAPVEYTTAPAPYPAGNSTTLATSVGTTSVTTTAEASSSTQGSPVGSSTTSAPVASSTGGASTLQMSSAVIAAFGALFAFLA
ncbi:hypothetical protein AC578_8256 [Pseudocercospora eumusae]|uniref:Uncharacterized protein n=1 Tax=Pseudocercospora eumusae TaxID=321146 RepID=A0A139HE78_9PEZI|nr:hypothetical protein AC578_8256 [Pseudocercospora eumusae]